MATKQFRSPTTNSFEILTDDSSIPVPAARRAQPKKKVPVAAAPPAVVPQPKLSNNPTPAEKAALKKQKAELEAKQASKLAAEKQKQEKAEQKKQQKTAGQKAAAGADSDVNSIPQKLSRAQWEAERKKGNIDLTLKANSNPGKTSNYQGNNYQGSNYQRNNYQGNNYQGNNYQGKKDDGSKGKYDGQPRVHKEHQYPSGGAGRGQGGSRGGRGQGGGAGNRPPKHDSDRVSVKKTGRVFHAKKEGAGKFNWDEQPNQDNYKQYDNDKPRNPPHKKQYHNQGTSTPAETPIVTSWGDEAPATGQVPKEGEEQVPADGKIVEGAKTAEGAKAAEGKSAQYEGKRQYKGGYKGDYDDDDEPTEAEKNYKTYASFAKEQNKKKKKLEKTLGRVEAKIEPRKLETPISEEEKKRFIDPLPKETFGVKTEKGQSKEPKERKEVSSTRKGEKEYPLEKLFVEIRTPSATGGGGRGRGGRGGRGRGGDRGARGGSGEDRKDGGQNQERRERNDHHEDGGAPRGGGRGGRGGRGGGQGGRGGQSSSRRRQHVDTRDHKAFPHLGQGKSS